MKSSRRSFLKAAAGVAATACGGCGMAPWLEEVRRHLHEMSRADIQAMLERLERRYRKELGVDVRVQLTPPRDGTLFGYALDLSRCVGCRRCVKACVAENNPSRAGAPGDRHHMPVEWIKVLEMDKARGIDLTHADAYYDAAEVPRPGHFYMPVQCHQCENPPCVKVCPVGATWKDKDGITVIDYDWCIGCRYCMVACPYGARRFNWTAPNLPKDQVNPDTDFLGNRPRPQGVVEKCTFCLQRVRNGRYPACVEVCPAGARKFGNLLDPESEIRRILDTKRVFILKEDLGTDPKFYYFFGT